MCCRAGISFVRSGRPFKAQRFRSATPLSFRRVIYAACAQEVALAVPRSIVFHGADVMSRCQEIPLHTQLKTGKLSLPISPSRHFFVRRSIRRRMESQSGRTEAANFPQTLHSFVHERRSKLICSHSKSKIYSRYWKRRKTLRNTRELVTNEKRCKTRDNDPCEGSAGAACYVTLSFKTANLRLAVCKCARHLFERGNGKGKQ